MKKILLILTLFIAFVSYSQNTKKVFYLVSKDILNSAPLQVINKGDKEFYSIEFETNTKIIMHTNWESDHPDYQPTKQFNLILDTKNNTISPQGQPNKKIKFVQIDKNFIILDYGTFKDYLIYAQNTE